MGYPPYGSYPGAGAGYGPGYPIMNPHPNGPPPYANPNMPGHYPGFQSGAPRPPQSYPGFQGGGPPHIYPGWGYMPPTCFPGGYPGFGMPWYPIAPMIMPGGANWGPCNNQTLGNTPARREQGGCTWNEGGPAPYNTNVSQDRDMAQGQIITPPVQDGDMAQNQNTNTVWESESPIDSIPKTLTYNGTGNWDAFEMKFTSYALAKQWTPAQCREYLCWCLEGKASEFYTATLKRGRWYRNAWPLGKNGEAVWKVRFARDCTGETWNAVPRTRWKSGKLGRPRSKCRLASLWQPPREIH